MTRMFASSRAARSRSAVLSIEPSETTTSSTPSQCGPSFAACWMTATLSTSSSPPLKTGTTTVRSGRADEGCSSAPRADDASITLTTRILGSADRWNARDGADEMCVTRVELGKGGRQEMRQGVVSTAPRAFDREPVLPEEVEQGPERHHVDVQERLARVEIRTAVGKRIAERPSRRDIRQRERLQPEEKRPDVVPAREVLGAHD